MSITLHWSDELYWRDAFQWYILDFVPGIDVCGVFCLFLCFKLTGPIFEMCGKNWGENTLRVWVLLSEGVVSLQEELL